MCSTCEGFPHEKYNTCTVCSLHVQYNQIIHTLLDSILFYLIKDNIRFTVTRLMPLFYPSVSKHVLEQVPACSVRLQYVQNVGSST